MASPTRYQLSYDFTAFQASNPSKPLPADKIEIEFNNLELTTDEIITNLGLIQKSDGTLANGIVKVESLATELTIGLESPTAWANGTVYTVNQTVIESNKLYRCDIAHTSGVFATDLAAGKWVLVANYDVFTSDAEAAKDAAEVAQTAAEAAKDAAEAVYDDFDDRYLGSKASDPSVDNDGDALSAGALYWNTTDNSMKVYTGSSWGDAIGATSLPVFVYTATGGETSVSGADDNGNTLAYAAGKVQVFINGVNETQDVTATNGTSITGITALSASDVVEIYAFTSVAVLEDISTHSLATPVKDDYLLFQDVNDSNLDRRAKIEDVLLVDGVIPQAPSGVVTTADKILFSDDSDSDATKQDTVQGIIDLVPDQSFDSADITGQTDVAIAADDVIVYSDTSDSGNLKKDTVQGIVDLVGSSGGGLLSYDVFTSSGTWNKPVGTNAVKVTVVGGGGGGGGLTGSGATGGTSSFGAHCSATGGVGGGEGRLNAGEMAVGGAGGSGSGGDLNMTGSDGANSWSDGTDALSGNGGSSTHGGGGRGGGNTSGTNDAGDNGNNYGGGGGGSFSTNEGCAGGGGGGTAIEYITSGIGSTETVTVGGGGAGGTGSPSGGAGAGGVVIVESYS
jgi:hypothetical protein